MTGQVRDNRVEAVNLGNKLMLPIKRHWLIPRENIAEVPPARSHLCIRSVFDIASAWAVVSGVGTKRRTTEVAAWPQDVKELHILVGANLKAALASVLFSSEGVPIHLWHSEKQQSSKTPAEALALVIQALSPQRTVKRHPLSSCDLVEAEQTLQAHFREMSFRTSVLFNVTSGNRLMSYAAQAVARLHPNVKLIYRDVDEVDFVFTMLDYGEYPASACCITAKDCACTKRYVKEVWDFLFSRFDANNKTAEEIAASYIEHLGMGSQGTTCTVNDV